TPVSCLPRVFAISPAPPAHSRTAFRCVTSRISASTRRHSRHERHGALSRPPRDRLPLRQRRRAFAPAVASRATTGTLPTVPRAHHHHLAPGVSTQRGARRLR